MERGRNFERARVRRLWEVRRACWMGHGSVDDPLEIWDNKLKAMQGDGKRPRDSRRQRAMLALILRVINETPR